MKELVDLEKNIKDIKRRLKKHGGLIITNRQVGKSFALLELLHENKKSYLLAFNRRSMKSLIRIYRKNFDDDGWKRIRDDRNKVDMENTYIDEYFFHKIYYTKFLGAVSTMRFPVIIKKYKIDAVINKHAHDLTKLQYNCEHTLKF